MYFRRNVSPNTGLPWVILLSQHVCCSFSRLISFVNCGRSKACFVVQFGQNPDFSGWTRLPQDHPELFEELKLQAFHSSNFHCVWVSNKAGMCGYSFDRQKRTHIKHFFLALEINVKCEIENKKEKLASNYVTTFYIILLVTLLYM